MMNRKSKIPKIIIGVAIGIMAGVFFWALSFVASFHGDPYGKAEAYLIDIQKNGDYCATSDILDVLYGFQCSHPSYRVMDIDTNGEKYHHFSTAMDDREKQQMCFFYFEDMDMTISCISEISDHNKPLVRLYAVNEGNIFREWKRINDFKEISRKKNNQIKKKFETEVLDNLGVKWRHKRFCD